MNTKRLLPIGAAWIGAFLLIAMVALSFQVRQVASQGPDESQIEEDLARAAEQNGSIQQEITVNPDAFGPGGTYSLFAGVSDSAIWQVQVDVTSNAFLSAFVGAQVWGAAHDPASDIVYFNNGSTLYEWPVGGAPNLLGTLVNGAGSAQALVSLAYYNGTLYGTKNIAPEAIHIVNPATLVVTPVVTYATSHDIGGLGIDADTGTFYGTDDSTNSLVTIANDGTVTTIAPYPAGQIDIDGLTIGDGKAYLVTDEPGFIYVYNLNTMAYEAPLNNPWPSSVTFSGAAWIEPMLVNGPAINLAKTVGTDINACATTDTITVTEGTQVTYCYDVTNTGTITLYYHDLVDSELGTIFLGDYYPLGPGASTFVTDTSTIFNTTVNTATWTSCNAIINSPQEGFDCGSTSATDVTTSTDSATVIVPPPSIDLVKTVGTDPNTCAMTNAITVTNGTQVTYCYDVTNTGLTELTVHDLDDSELGSILSGFPFSLMPGASVFVTQSTTIYGETTNTATWTACNIDGPASNTCFGAATFDVVSDTDQATVYIWPASIDLVKTVGTDPNSCAGTSSISVVEGTEVTYCYDVTNTSNVTLTIHDLVDDQLGLILNGFPFTLAPGASAYLTQSAVILTNTTNIATWTACNVPPPLEGGGCDGVSPYDVVSATDTATVMTTPPIPANPSIALTKTVGLDGGTCAATDNIEVASGTVVYYCYTVENTGNVTFTIHDLDDDKLGSLLSGYNYVLGPGDTTAVMGYSATITSTVTNVATWTAYVDVPMFGPVVATATDSATVTLGPTAVSLTNFGGGTNPIILPIMVSILAFLVMAAGFIIRRANPISRDE